MSYLSEHPDLVMECLAKLVHRAGGYVKLTHHEHPSGPFNLASRVGDQCIELRLLDGEAGPQ